MSLTDFRTLGRSGLVVSPLALGTMTFGPGAWGADAPTSRAIFDAYRDAGGNFVDTADIYSVNSSATPARATTSFWRRSLASMIRPAR
jgi:aryl-alcohol dehydrogenase-like predicted oxidoreductase